MRFTGGVSSPVPTPAPPPMPPPPPPRPAGPYWRGWPEIRADLRSAAWLVVGLAVAGLPVGVVWWLLAPRADYRITADGPVALGDPTAELLVADDVLFALVLAGAGLLAGTVAWRLRRRRGVAVLVALALGAALSGAVAWQVGEFLGAGPSQADLADVGRVVTTPLSLGSLAALAVAPFTAVLAYLVAVLYVADDGLGRTADVPLAARLSSPAAPSGGTPGACEGPGGRGPSSVDGHGGGELLQRHRYRPEFPQQGELPPQEA